MNVLTNTNGCGLCRENEIKFYKAIPQLDRKIVQCRNCGLVFVHPMNGTFVTLDFEALEEREEKYHRMNVEAEREGKHDEDMINEEEETRTLHFNRRKKTSISPVFDQDCLKSWWPVVSGLPSGVPYVFT